MYTIMHYKIAIFVTLALVRTDIIKMAESIKTRLTWVNGIGHNFDHMLEGEIMMSSLFGGKKVDFCFNPTCMTSDNDYLGYLGDLTQAGTQKFGRMTAEVDELVSHLKQCLAAVGESGVVVHIAHSQGALITALCLKQLSPNESSRLEVISFGGGVAMRKSDFPSLRRVVNYYSVNDPLLVINPSAMRALRSGFTAMYGGNGYGTGGTEGNGGGGASEFVFLSPRGGDPVLDHGLFGPTYIEALAWEGRRFARVYETRIERAWRATSFKIEKVTDVMFKCTILPLLVWFMGVWEWLKSQTAELKKQIMEKFIHPLSLFVGLLVEIMKEAIRLWKGEEKYEPLIIPND